MPELKSKSETICCSGCGLERKTKPTTKGLLRLPGGWKRRPDPEGGEAVLCKTCWGKLYRLRAVAFPVASVAEGGSWQEFQAATRQALFRARTLAQWATNRLAATDVNRTLDMGTLPAHPPLGAEGKVYLYGLAAREFADWGEWSGAYTCAQGILRATELKYNARRREVVWDNESSVPTIRSQPYPVPAQNWSAEYAEEVNEETGQVSRVPSVTLPLMGHRWRLLLRGGHRRRRQLAAFQQLVSGAAEQCELAIYRKRVEGNRGRSGTNGRTANGGGQRVRYDIMIKLVCWLPRETREGQRVKEGVLSVRSSKSAFLVAAHPDFERPWLLNRREVCRRVETHARRLQEMSEDSKCETRPMLNPREPWRALTPEERRARQRRKRIRRHRLDYYEKICRLYRNYIDTFVKEAAAWLAAYAKRVNVAKVVLDFSEKGYCAGFPWKAMQDKIQANLEDRGICFEAIAAKREEENNGDGASDAPTIVE